MKKKFVILIILSVIFITCLYLSLFAGYKDVGINYLIKVFHLSSDSDSIILEVLRFPRALKAVIAGSSLALAGMFMQSVSKNPLAEPYITGISSGAGLGIVLSILLFNSMNYSFFGFIGAILSSLLVILISGFSRFAITKLILIGLSLNIFVSSLISLIILMNPNKAYVMMLILSGGLTNSEMISDKSLFAMFLVGLVFSLFLIPKLNFMRLDDELVLSFRGKRTFYTILILITSAFLSSISVFAAGILGFVGIIAPQISRMIVGQDFRWLFFVNIFIGSSLILFADFISRIVIYPLQVPLGLIVAFIGAPIFVVFLTKKGGIFND